MKIILLIMIGISILNAGLTKSGNTVTDSSTQLQWQDDAVVGYATTWQGAIQRCEILVLDTHSDWRLPNINELTSLVDDTRSRPTIDITVFEHTISNSYWSSTTASLSRVAWVVSFYNGLQNNRNKTTTNFVRCVRAGQ